MFETPSPSSPQDDARTISTKVWLDDGNVVLQAEDTLFRVLRSILLRESVVFRDMFSVPQPAGGEGERYDGCPIVRVQDRAEDMALFLSALFDANALDEECDFHAHITLLDMSSKYQAVRLLRRVMTVFTHHFPSTLPGHDHIGSEDWHTVLYGCQCAAGSRSRLPAISTSDIYLLISLARKINMHILLPTLYLRLATTDLGVIIQGRLAGAISEDELKLILSAQHALRGLARDTVFPFLFDPSRRGPRCTTTDSCSRVFHTICTTIVECHGTHGAELKTFVPLDFEVTATRGLCNDCKSNARVSYIAGRSNAWSKLPGMFDLPSWDELQANMQANMQQA